MFEAVLQRKMMMTADPMCAAVVEPDEMNETLAKAQVKLPRRLI